jgi:uncharacterized RDD family membrane protein YckC
MGDIAPIPLEYQKQMPAEGVTCPVCLKPIAKPQKCKTLYGVLVCNGCRNGFANRRQAAYVVDIILYYLVMQGITYASAGVLFRSGGMTLAEVLMLLLIWVVLPLLFTFKDAFGGWSPGKRLFGVRVVDATTREPIPPIKSVQRNLVLMIPYVGVIGGLVTMMRGQRWGDRWANTMVTWCKYSFREPFVRPGWYCRGCGYDLTGNVSGRCPECGMEIGG